MKTETIEEKTYRLVNEAYGNTFTSLTAALDNVAFAYTCKAIELAIAEEREAAARICERIPRTGWKIGEESWAKESVALIRQRAAPKDEVSE